MQIQDRKAQNLSENKKDIVERDKESWFAQPSMICEARTCLIFPFVSPDPILLSSMYENSEMI